MALAGVAHLAVAVAMPAWGQSPGYPQQPSPYGNQQQFPPGFYGGGGQPQQGPSGGGQPGQFGGGQMPPNQFGGGQMPPGQFGGGQMPPGQFGGGQMPPGQFGGGQMPPGQFGGGQAPQAQSGLNQQMLQQLGQAERQDFGIPPTAELHGGAPHGPTPSSIPGAQVVTTLGLVSLLSQSGASVVVLDALGGQARLPNAVPAAFAAQPGSFDDQVQQQLAQTLMQATRGDRSRPIVVYCSDPHCWMSYNVALRVANLRYQNVLWYRGGLWAWQQAQLPVQGG